MGTALRMSKRIIAAVPPVAKVMTVPRKNNSQGTSSTGKTMLRTMMTDFAPARSLGMFIVKSPGSSRRWLEASY
jgi:hypothetical protein